MIAAAVMQAIAAGRGDAWSDYLPREFCGHRMHVRYAERVDGWDIRNFEQLRRVGFSMRAKLSHSSRADGSLRPSLMFSFSEDYMGVERRVGERRGPEFRRDREEVAA